MGVVSVPVCVMSARRADSGGLHTCSTNQPSPKKGLKFPDEHFVIHP